MTFIIMHHSTLNVVTNALFNNNYIAEIQTKKYKTSGALVCVICEIGYCLMY